MTKLIKVLAVLLTFLGVPYTTQSAVTTKCLSWKAPTHNTDGSVLTDLRGFVFVWGKAPDKLLGARKINSPTQTRWCVKSDAARPYYAAVRAFNSQGVESANSNVVLVFP